MEIVTFEKLGLTDLLTVLLRLGLGLVGLYNEES